MSQESVSTHCACVVCSVCGGTGYMSVMSKPSDSFGDDYADPIPCDACSGGIVEECEACRARALEAFMDQYDIEFHVADSFDERPACHA